MYATKWPNPVPRVFGFHEVWHLFVLSGSFGHFWAVFRYLTWTETYPVYDTPRTPAELVADVPVDTANAPAVRPGDQANCSLIMLLLVQVAGSLAHGFQQVTQHIGWQVSFLYFLGQDQVGKAVLPADELLDVRGQFVFLGGFQ